jgi:pantoate--beta-alanine ligase
MCGKSRPGHFDGVATVVTKLFNIVQPDFAFFGLKDAQQAAVICQMTKDLNIPVNVVTCPTVREHDGLAMSSRNVYLSDEERQQAVVLSQCLKEAKAWLEAGLTDVHEVRARIESKIRQSPLAKLDYVEILTYPQMQPLERWQGEQIIIALAVYFGKTRLIDNILLGVATEPDAQMAKERKSLLPASH